ncbi:restriction endonuclease subunit S [Clostridium botulinum]|uniref:restriction endonuclease subunit S n=1 Tax=Clostridium TaxID=1485 RepID=UPI0013F7C10C|nr:MULTISPECIES: restriction endonuclease subunit S [Clostridium]MCS6132735.1 restriction endonuclease subunit S [Clostridium botulinum]NFL44336.1 hypothetical protein [Clostridium botulinum]NFL88587.1 hypothetical protein [Clostridium botulinum]
MEFKKLGEIFKITSGGTPSKSNNEFYENGTIPWIKTGDLKEKNLLKSSEFITELALEKSSAKLFPKNTVLIAMYGATIGATSILKIEATTNQACCAFLPSEEIIPDFLYYYFKAHKSEIVSLGVGGAQPNISATILKNIKIPVLSSIKQQKIICTLDKAQELIDKRKVQIEALDELVKSQFIEMFGNPSINDKGWIINKLSTVVSNIENGKSFVCENFNRSNEYPAILKLSAVTYGIYNANENKALTHEDLFVSSVEVKSGDLLFTRKNTPELVGMSAFVYDTQPNLMMPDLIFRFNTNEKINKIYLWKLINHDLFRERIKSLSNGSAKSMSNISKQRLMELNIPIPPIEFQNQFADFVKQTDKLKFEMQNSLKELEDNFNSLMQRAFKGELFK